MLYDKITQMYLALLFTNCTQNAMTLLYHFVFGGEAYNRRITGLKCLAKINDLTSLLINSYFIKSLSIYMIYFLVPIVSI